MFRDPVPSPEPQLFCTAAVAMRPLRVGLIGIGTVGAGTFRVLARNHATYRHAVRFGLVQETGAVVVFHFERPNA